MKILETFDVYGHEVMVSMENKVEEPSEFMCEVSVDNAPPHEIYISFNENENIRPDKPLYMLVEDAYDYEKNDTLGEFIKNLGYNNSSQQINAGYMVFMSSKQTNEWLKSCFTVKEVEMLFDAIEKTRALDISEMEDETNKEDDIGR